MLVCKSVLIVRLLQVILINITELLSRKIFKYHDKMLATFGKYLFILFLSRRQNVLSYFKVFDDNIIFLFIQIFL